ncbi:hypothetical protein S40293_02258 [Stachybotrys chartarum IBT 40293]|nr:hypothetical protein S40293_02258 [Stachybotrys chartarum IBT 40293]
MQDKPIAKVGTEESPSAFETHLEHLNAASPRLPGLSFANLDSYGFVSSALYQPTFASHLYDLPELVWTWLSRRTHRKIHILQDFEGLIHAGEMLLVLGRPGSGCSTLLKTLAGETHGFHIRDQTQINYGGMSYDQMRRALPGERIYLAELDVHFSELTVGETLQFANAAKVAAGSASTSGPEDVARIATALFRLQDAHDTPIGDATIRGVSGGEKRRTSLAEAFLRDAGFQFWDNSTRGLDSSTALHFVKLLRTSTRRLRSTVAMSMYQVSETMYKEFDNVTLLYEGRQIYFGPVEAASDYFTSLGFLRPAHTTTPDFITSLTSPAERIIQPGFEAPVPRTAEEFALKWKESNEAAKLRSDIEAFNAMHPMGTMGDPMRSQHTGGSWEKRQVLGPIISKTLLIHLHRQVRICLWRGLLRLRNNYVPTVSAVFANALIAIIVGTIYYQLSNTTAEMEARAILLFFATIHACTTPSADIAMMWAQRPIVEKHAKYNFHQPVSEAISSLICVMPQKILESALYNIPVYFMTNLRREAGAFFTYWLFMFVTLMTMTMLFRLVGSLSRRMEQTLVPVSVLVLLCIVYTGFAVPPPYMVAGLAWIRWLNPASYTYESLMINEFHGRHFSCSAMMPAGPAYDSLEDNFKTCSILGSMPGDDVVQGSLYPQENFGYEAPHLWRNLGILLGMMVFFAILHLLSAQFIHAQQSRGEVLLFKRSSRAKFSGGERPLADSDVDPEMISAGTNYASGTQVDGCAIYSSLAEADPAPVLPAFQTQSSILHWNSLSYQVKAKGRNRQILNDVNGWVEPGTLTVLMGVTGAGKTTLLDVLAGRAQGRTVLGDVFVNGQPRKSDFGQRIGYVLQQDIHLPSTTVREALTFSALLRQPRFKECEKQVTDYVDVVLDMLEMLPYAEAVVGVPGEGLNVEQRRRLTIAVELVAKPDILLFFDEPTSGLDSQSAWSICTLLRKLADSGQTILCTLHQPSSQLFDMFDRLLLLGRGGEQLYFGDIGPGGSTAVEYFEKNGFGKCPAGSNPAEWIIDITGVSSGCLQASESGSEHSYASQKWNESLQKQNVMQYLLQLEDTLPGAGSGDLHTATSYKADQHAASVWQQFTIVTKRNFQDYWRDPTSLYSKLFLCLGISLTNGVSFINSPLDMQGITNITFSVFAVLVLFVMLNQQIITRMILQRDFFEAREKRAQTYPWPIFVASNIVVELTWQTIAAVLFFLTWYYPTGMWKNRTPGFSSSERAGLTFILIWLFCAFTSTISQVIAVALPLQETAIQMASLLYWFMIVFCGILVFPINLPNFWVFVYRASPFTYLASGLLAAGVGGTQIRCSDNEYQSLRLPTDTATWGSTCGDYLLSLAQSSGGYVLNPGATAGNCLYCPVKETDQLFASLGMEVGRKWANVGFSMAYVVFNVLATFLFYFICRVI